MRNKIMNYFKGKNPYLLASFAIVMVTVGIMFVLLQDKEPAGTSEEVVSTDQISVIGKESIEVSTEVESQPSNEDVLKYESAERVIEEVEVVDTEADFSIDEADENSTEIKSTESEVESMHSEMTATEKEQHNSEVMKPKSEEPEKEEPTEVSKEEFNEIPSNQPEEELPYQPEQKPEPEEESQVEEAHVHSWIFVSYFQEPTCSNGGLITQICAHCGETQITGGTPTGEHDYEVETPGDCCSAEVVVCRECNFREVREKNAQNHVDVEDGFCYGCGHKIV